MHQIQWGNTGNIWSRNLIFNLTHERGDTDHKKLI